LVGTLLDITERKRAEETLRKLSHAVEQSPASVVITDTAGTIEYVNPKFTEVTGYGAEEAIGRNPRFLKSGETPRGEYERLWQTIRDGHDWRGEFHNRKKSGELYWELASISPIRDPEGRITHYIAVKEDITERRALESQLKHSQKMDAIGRLAGGIAHDFNNILTAIIGYASSLLMKTDADPRLTNVLDQIIGAAERGAGLTQSLLSFSRKQVTNPKPVNLNDIVGRMEDLLVRLIGEDIELKTVLSPESPIVMADSMQIEQVLMNLATNGRDAMPDGGQLTITTGLINLDSRFALTHGYGNPGIYALMAVSDAGSGMDDETVKRIFEPFYTTKEVGKGTGLGLSIVYGIVEKHNGYVNCYSEPGKGSVFTVYLPTTGETAELSSTSPVPRLDRGTGTILLAEDDAAVRKITRDLLEEHGYRVIEAVDGEDALSRFRKHWEEVNLLVLDVIMPKLNGKEVYDEISRMRPDVRAIFTSGYSAEIIQQKGMLNEGTVCLPKPLPQQVLLARIREVLNHG
jgi:two-component system NtrC family sensor kinase